MSDIEKDVALEPPFREMHAARLRFVEMDRHQRQTFLLKHLGQVAEFVAAGVASNDTIRHAVALHRTHQALWDEEMKAEKVAAEQAAGRLALLHEVASHKVYRDLNGHSYHKTWSNRITARMEELESAGWVKATSYNKQWYVTDAGRTALLAAGGVA